MNDKEIICQRLAKAESYAASILGLLNAADDAHYELTLDGWIDEYMLHNSTTREEAALLWMKKHYDSTAAATRAAMNLAEAVGEQINDIWLDLRALFPEK